MDTSSNKMTTDSMVIIKLNKKIQVICKKYRRSIIRKILLDFNKSNILFQLLELICRHKLRESRCTNAISSVISHGANINGKDNRGHTPLIYCVNNKLNNIAQLNVS